MGRLYFGDNLDILREHIPDESVDLIYLDPPFNSKRDYSVLFKTPKGHASDAQVQAFEDTWHWGEQAEREFDELVHQANTDVSEMIQSLRRFLRENDVMAYLTMMANRLLELHRVLKPTGSLYLHCDPTASHYLKIVLDAVFGPENFQNEITWKRTSAHSDSKTMGNAHDILFLYTKTDESVWNKQYQPYNDSYIKSHYRYVDVAGRRYRTDNLTATGLSGGGYTYEWNGVTKIWRCPQEKMRELHDNGRLHYTKSGSVEYIRYLDEMPGTPLQDVWDDISPINSQAAERLGYPTQKPLALLERIIQASSHPGDVVLDPFCGCGTAVHAAQKLEREWIGIDITHLAIGLIEKRLKDAFPGLQFEVLGTPKDAAGAQELAARDKYQFQWWACALVGAQPYQGKKKGADSGIDGVIYFKDDVKSAAKKIVVSVKGGERVTVAMIRELAHVVEREKAAIGLFVTLAPPTKPMLTEAAGAGFYTSPHHGNFPRLQILTIEGLLAGTEAPKYVDLSQGGLSFKKAKQEKPVGEQPELF
ncbi:MAG TPA: DNA methyltransferase [Anaerolineae bacterium]|nr:DNA methyltransferase [Anaerolineae bacterium]